MITLTNPEVRPDVHRWDLVYFSADVRERIAVCVVQAHDINGARIQGIYRRLEFNDSTNPSFADFASGTGGSAYRNSVEAWIATLQGFDGVVS